MAHRLALHAKVTVPKAGPAGPDSSGHWPDKVTKHRAKAALDTASEQWVDGPGAAIYPDSGGSGEQWVDGPQAFLLQTEHQPQQQQQTPHQQQQQQQQAPSSHSPSPRGDTGRRMKNRKVEAEEQWVDGPREMMASSAGSTGTNTPLHTSSSKTEPLSRAVVGQPSQAPKLSTAVSDKALKQALMKHLEKERPDSPLTAPGESVHSRNHASAAGPGTGLEGCRLREGPCPLFQDCPPFQWDKRQSGDGVSVVGVEVLEDVEKTPEELLSSSFSSSSSLHRKHHKDHLSRRLMTSSRHSPKPSPASTRKAEVEAKTAVGGLHKSDLPGSASPTHRVAQWIKSVTKADTAVTTDVTALQVTSTLPATTDVTMADAETNTEHDSDFERMADCDEGNVPQDCTTGGGVCSGLLAEAAMDSSGGDTSQGSASGARQDSLYEQRVEEQLENLPAHHRDRTHLSKDGGDSETFSSQSARDTSDTDREDCAVTEPGKDLVDLKPKARLGKLRGVQEGAPARASMDLMTLLPDLSKPMLSRKPDGASNPHLNKEFPEEECAGVTEQCVNSAQYASLCSASDSYTTAQVGFVKEGTVGEVSDSKPPPPHCRSSLPQKTPSSSCPSPKTNGLTKITAVSSSCSSSAPPPPLLPTSSPKLPSNKDPSAVQKQASPKGSLLCNGRKEKGGKGGKEKTSLSTSSLSSSPASLSGKGSRGGGKCSGGSKLPVFNSTTSSSSSKSSVPAPSSSSPSSASPSSKESKLRKKDKESGKTGRGNSSNISTTSSGGKYGATDLSIVQQRKVKLAPADPDLGKEKTGGVGGRQERRLLSPYATVTQPKPNSHSSSGHGSDNSSIISTEVHSQPSSKCDKPHGGTSSGYESMLRESEETASSSSSSSHPEDSSSEVSDRKKGSKRKGPKRSRSAPARSSESPSSTGGGSQGSRVWVDPRHGHKVKDDPLQLKTYDMEDVERLQRRRQDDNESRSCDRGRERGGRDAQTKQPGPQEGIIKGDLLDSRDRISLQENSGWGLDCKFLFCFCKSRPVKGTEV